MKGKIFCAAAGKTLAAVAVITFPAFSALRVMRIACRAAGLRS